MRDLRSGEEVATLAPSRAEGETPAKNAPADKTAKDAPAKKNAATK